MPDGPLRLADTTGASLTLRVGGGNGFVLADVSEHVAGGCSATVDLDRDAQRSARDFLTAVLDADPPTGTGCNDRLHPGSWVIACTSAGVPFVDAGPCRRNRDGTWSGSRENPDARPDSSFRVLYAADRCPGVGEQVRNVEGVALLEPGTWVRSDDGDRGLVVDPDPQHPDAHRADTADLIVWSSGRGWRTDQWPVTVIGTPGGPT